MSRLLPSLRWSAGVGVCLAFFLVSRLPIVRCPYELNVDESQLAAQAMRYGRDLTPWRSVEGESNGPVDSWFILGAHQLGLPYDYRTLHLLAALCLAGILLATTAAARRLAGETAALAGLAAGAWWLAWAPVQEFEHFASELVPCLLLSCALAVVIRARQSASGADWRLGLAGGVLLGLAPWGKLQCAPLALALGLWMVGDALLARGPAPGVRWRYAAALTAGALLPGVLLGGWVIGAGAGDELWRSYVVAGLAHTAPRTGIEHLRYLRDLVFLQPSSPWFCDVALLAAASACVRAAPGLAPTGRRPLLLALVLLGAGLAATLRPITQWAHYAIFCLPGLVLGAALAARRLVGAATGVRRRIGWAALSLGILPLPVAYFFHQGYFRDFDQAWHYERSRDFDVQVFLAKAVRYYAPQARSLAVWGWKPSLYVDLGLAPAVRNAGYVYLRDGNPAQEFLRAAFLRDLRQSAPDAIVDVEDYIWKGRRQTPPEIFPELAAELARRYHLRGQGKVDRSDDYSLVINVYLRNR
jgi:hypothetical protein